MYDYYAASNREYQVQRNFQRLLYYKRFYYDQASNVKDKHQ